MRFNENPNVAIIIPTYNEEKYIGDCLNSVFSSSIDNYEVIVIDDSSTDSTVSIIEKYPCRLIKLDRNLGAANAKNIGIDQSRSDLIFILDADATLEKNALANILEIIKKNPKLSGVNGMWSFNPLNQGWFPKQQAFDMHFQMYNQLSKTYSFYWGNGSAIKKNIFLDSGSFNTDYKGAGCEDYEITFRIPKENKFIVSENITIRHHFPPFFFEGIKKYIKRSALHTATLLTYKKSDGGFHSTFLNFISLVTPYLAILLILANISFNEVSSYTILAPIIIFLIINIKKIFFVFKKSNIFFGLYFIVMSFIVTLLIAIGATLGVFGYCFGKIGVSKSKK